MNQVLSNPVSTSIRCTSKKNKSHLPISDAYIKVHSVSLKKWPKLTNRLNAITLNYQSVEN